MHLTRVEYGNQGRVRAHFEGSPFVVYLRYVERSGRLSPIDMYVESEMDRIIATKFLRDLPLGQVTKVVNADAALVRSRMAVPGPDLRRLARHFLTRWHSPTPDHWVAASLLAQLPESGVPQAPMPALPRARKRKSKADGWIPRIPLPTSPPHSDQFYEAVAAVYLAQSRRPGSTAGAIADANGVPVTTVDRWIRVCRKRGLVPASRRSERS